MANRVATSAVVALLDGGAVAVAGVVDQDVDRAEALLAGPNGLGHLAGVGDVERDGEGGVGVGVGEVLDGAGVAGGEDGVVAGVEHGPGQVAAEAGRAAGDQPGGHACQSSCPAGRRRISWIASRRGRLTAKAMTSATSSAVTSTWS